MLDKLAALGHSAQITLDNILSKVHRLDNPKIEIRSAEIAINRKLLGYGKHEFPHEHGATQLAASLFNGSDLPWQPVAAKKYTPGEGPKYVQ